MSAVPAFMASLLAAWPTPASEAAVGSPTGDKSPIAVMTMADDRPDPLAVWKHLATAYLPPELNQVRIEQRIIWRISPIPGPARRSMLATELAPLATPRFVERKFGECVPLASLVGGRPQGTSRLMLLMRDHRLLAANLEKACSARDFYSGFYVEKLNADGRLCADRDRILARNGARCQITSFRQLVAVD